MTPTPTEIIERLGGPAKVARLIGIKAPSVCEWRGKARIPEASLYKLAPHIERVMGISRHELCPEVFGAPRGRRRKVG